LTPANLTTMTARKELVSIAIGLGLILASSTLFAADDGKHPCANVRDNTDRLACYDQAFGKPAKSAPAPPEQKFGLPEKEVPRKGDQSRENAAKDSVAAAVQSLSRQRDGKFIVTLDNAQVWAQSEINSQADVAVGDAVTVRRGALGSYLLVTKDGIATRVRRVK
jgi:hypothetical protein